MIENEEINTSKELTTDQKKKREAALKLLKEIEEDNNNFGEQFINTLKKTPDEMLVQGITDFVGNDLDNKSIENDCQNVKSLSIGFQNVWFINLINNQINNGGIAQFYLNYSFDYLCDSYNSFINIGAFEFASIIEKSIQVITKNQDYINTIKKVNSLKFFSDDKILELFSGIDNEYLKISADVDKILVKYIRKNYKEFG